MTTINLLPWREELRKLRLQQFIVYSIVAIVAVSLFCTIIHLFYSSVLADQYTANNQIQAEITTLDQTIQEVRAIREKKAELTNRMEVVQHLQTNRSEVVTMFDEFVRTLPPGVYVTSLHKEGSVITVSGIAESNTRVSDFMKNIEKSQAFMDPRLTEIKSEDKNNPNLRFFELKMEREILDKQA